MSENHAVFYDSVRIHSLLLSLLPSESTLRFALSSWTGRGWSYKSGIQRDRSVSALSQQRIIAVLWVFSLSMMLLMNDLSKVSLWTWRTGNTAVEGACNMFYSHPPRYNLVASLGYHRLIQHSLNRHPNLVFQRRTTRQRRSSQNPHRKQMWLGRKEGRFDWTRSTARWWTRYSIPRGLRKEQHQHRKGIL